MKWIGAFCILISCGGVGFSIAMAHKRNEKYQQELIRILEYMYSELQYRMTPLPELLELVIKESKGGLRSLFSSLLQQLQLQTIPEVSSCMEAALEEHGYLPETLKKNLNLLGCSLGRFDLSGQLSGLQSVKQLCMRDLEGLLANRDVRLRSYRTLGLCAGTALVILFI